MFSKVLNTSLKYDQQRGVSPVYIGKSKLFRQTMPVENMKVYRRINIRPEPYNFYYQMQEIKSTYVYHNFKH